MTGALEGESGQQHAQAALYPRERPSTHFTGGWVGFQGWSGRAESFVPTGIRSRTVQSIVSHYTDLCTRSTSGLIYRFVLGFHQKCVTGYFCLKENKNELGTVVLPDFTAHGISFE